MSKILITSDIHFDTYPTRTPTQDYRLNQSYQVIENLLEVARKEGAEYIFILGDLLEKQNRDSPVHSVVKKCLEKLMTGFRCGYYILGNHDMNARTVSSESSENDKINSYIHLYCPDSLIYADRKIIDIDGVSFGFRNYSAAETLDLSFIEESGRSLVDVFCGHSSQNYTDGDPLFPVQAYDEGKVRLYSFFGHIHQSVWKGNKVSIGVPQRAKITDDIPKVVIFDTLTKSWKYVDADPGKKLMDLKETDTGDSDYFDPAQNVYYIIKKKPTENKELLKAISETNYDKIFDAEVKAHGLEDIFRTIKDSTPLESLERLDLNFQVTAVRIKNWRTIKDYSQTFKKGDQFLVSGHNGAGKSSLYSALCFGLSGKCPGQLKDNIRFGEKDTRVEVDLEFQGSGYTVKRGNSLVELWKNGQQMELGNKTQTKEGILKELPFIEAMDLLYYNEGNQRILGNSSSSDTAKLQILYKILGLNEIDAYNTVATDLYKKLSKEFTSKHEQYLIQEASLGEKKKYLNDLEIKYGSVSGFDVDSRVLELRKTLTGYQDLYRQKQEYDQEIQRNQRVLSEIKGTELLLGTLQESLVGYGDPDTLEKEKTKISSELSENQGRLQELLKSQTEYSRLVGSREFIIKEGQQLKKDLDNLEEEIHRPVMCSVYGIQCSLVTEDMKREKLQSRKEDLETKRKQKLQEYYDINTKISEMKSDPSAIEELNRVVSELQGKLSEVTGKINEYTRVQNQISQKKIYLESLKTQASVCVRELIELPGDILTRISDLSSEISTLEGYKRLQTEYQQANLKFQELKKEYTDAKNTLDKYSEFINLTKPSGIIYTKIFEIIMTSFSDSRIRYEVNVTKRGENRYINISSYIKRKTGDVSYLGASQGERCMMDIHFLSNLKVKFGLIILDEFLGNLDQDNHDEALKKMQSLETNLLFVTSHKDNLIPFPSRIEVRMDKNTNESKYTVG
jgi:ABC-type molybdenum transport system ATPase subunit/photorepair protein PhrA/UDP-2,3-diacylglucosamine pyrophosphatase LpxH